MTLYFYKAQREESIFIDERNRGGPIHIILYRKIPKYRRIQHFFEVYKHQILYQFDIPIINYLLLFSSFTFSPFLLLYWFNLFIICQYIRQTTRVRFNIDPSMLGEMFSTCSPHSKVYLDRPHTIISIKLYMS